MNINVLIEAIKNGEKLSDLSKKWHMPVSSLRWLLIKEGVDYRKIMLQRKTKNSEQKFEQCLKFARENDRIPSIQEFKDMGIPTASIGIYINKLTEKGFKRKFSSESKIEDDELLKELLNVYKKVGMVPQNKHIVKYSKYSNTTYITRFGTLSNAINLMKKRYLSGDINHSAAKV